MIRSAALFKITQLLTIRSIFGYRRGIPAQPTLNGFCGDYDWDLYAASGQMSQVVMPLTFMLVSISLFAQLNVMS